MARPGGGTGGGKVTVKGTRNTDTITVGTDSVTIVTGLQTKVIASSTEQVAAGFLLKGDAGDDIITGGTGPDEIDGGGGSDTIIGGGGADLLKGGEGNDTLIGTMDDRFDGGRGVDTLDLSGSSKGAMVDIAGTGTFFKTGSVTDSNNDGFLEVDLGAGGGTNGVAQYIENVLGSPHNDLIFGNSFANVLRGGGGDDYISAGHDDGAVDHLFGDAGNDELWASGGNDVLEGGDGADKFIFGAWGRGGDWVILDYDLLEGDVAYLDPSAGSYEWSTVEYDGLDSLRANFADGDSITFVGITDTNAIMMASTNDWGF